MISSKSSLFLSLCALSQVHGAVIYSNVTVDTTVPFRMELVNGEIMGTFANPVASGAPIVKPVDSHGVPLVLSKRSTDDRIINLIRDHDDEWICYDLVDPKTVTTTITKTTTTTKRTTTNVKPSTKQVTKTSVAPRPADVVVTSASYVTTHVVSVVATDPTTSYDAYPSASIVSDVSVSTYTSTITLYPPGASVVPSKRGGDSRLPSYLRGYSRDDVVRACRAWLPVKTKTKTQTYTTTQTSTFTSVKGATPINTNTIISTPPASTVTSVSEADVYVTDFSTTTTLTVVPSTYIVPSTVSTVSVVTKTTSVCAGATPRIDGIGSVSPGTLIFSTNLSEQGKCCEGCYNTPGCNAWWFVQSSICVYAVNDGPNQNPSPQCPSGLGDYVLIDGNTGFAGKGQCGRNRL